MRQETFEERHREDWARLDRNLGRAESAESDRELTEVPQRYRRLCQHLALARYRGYGLDLVGQLNELAVRGHHQMYTRRGRPVLDSARDLLVAGFPRAVRREWRLVLLAHLLFYLPFIGMMAGIAVEPALVYSVLDPGSVAGLESMYDPASDHHLQERPSESDVFMFGFYIKNNIGIAFRTFASGVLAGLGSLFFLLYNGFALGAAAGHINAVGYGQTFWSFVVTHGAFELTAIVLSGAAGLRLGLAVLSPGRRTRGRALLHAGKQALPVVYGMTGMLLVAAFIEAFWSSSATLPDAVKYSVGGACWLLVYAYMLLAGRGGPRGA